MWSPFWAANTSTTLCWRSSPEHTINRSNRNTPFLGKFVFLRMASNHPSGRSSGQHLHYIMLKINTRAHHQLLLMFCNNCSNGNTLFLGKCLYFSRLDTDIILCQEVLFWMRGTTLEESWEKIKGAVFEGRITYAIINIKKQGKNQQDIRRDSSQIIGAQYYQLVKLILFLHVEFTSFRNSALPATALYLDRHERC